MSDGAASRQGRLATGDIELAYETGCAGHGALHADDRLVGAGTAATVPRVTFASSRRSPRWASTTAIRRPSG